MNTKINAHTVKLLLDTGSNISILNGLTWKKIGHPPLRRTKNIARGSYGWLVVWVLWHINFYRLFNAKSILKK